MSNRKISNYKVMACFDTETTNDSERKTAFAITYQLSILRNHLTKVSDINNDNVNDTVNDTVNDNPNDNEKRAGYKG